ncbi:hypothetical protein IMZ08_06510 [Bacillus luteolus]|uniref:Uncharacterized protein n=1 Tax=Litchfieldia luteola TaxID=682179 RepID=A0ABR9QGT1_9BACI|nr:hypothetical protein [Cytobacillus luteolus]MBE4907704.1 hypothetical protein [Cytobacillus luteolus]
MSGSFFLNLNLDRSFALQAFAFRGEEVEPPRRFAPVGSRPFLYFPQESNAFRSNSLNLRKELATSTAY